MFCGQCGTENSQKDTHCIVCGSSLRVARDGDKCETCKATLPREARYCWSCGESVQEATGTGELFAGPSFEDDDLTDVDLAELPDWLRDLAPQGGDRRGVPMTPSQPTPDDLPDWLRDGVGDDSGFDLDDGFAQPSTADPVRHHPASEFELVSGEDLPDWLKALGEEGDSEPVDERPAREEPSLVTSNAVALLLQAPAVSRAWLREGRLVHDSVTDEARRDFAPLQEMHEPASQPTSEAVTTRFQPVSEQHVAFDTESGAQMAAQSRWSRQRWRLITLALFIIVVLLLAFVLLQSL